MMFQVVLVLYFTVLATGTPPGSSSMIYADDKVQTYLTKFGYLPESNPETGNLRTEDQLRDAIRNLQRFSGIPVTGEIDDATRKLMKARRCGLADRQNPRYSRTRRKRFTIHGQRWPYRNLTWRNFKRKLDEAKEKEQKWVKRERRTGWYNKIEKKHFKQKKTKRRADKKKRERGRVGKRNESDEKLAAAFRKERGRA